MTAPKVSVCVIVYNQERYVRRCLQDLVDQKTGFPFEVIVGDDASRDGTATVIREFAARYPGIVKPIFQERNIGRGNHNYQTVHNAASGDYVAHVDGDDECLPGKLQAQADFLDRNPGCTAVWHRVDFFDDDGRFTSGKETDYSMFPGGRVDFDRALRLGSFAAHSSMMYRRSARKTVSPPFVTLDLFYTWEYLSSGWGMVLDEVLGRVRINSSSASTPASRSYRRKLVAHHAGHFLRKHPERRRDLFLFSLTNLLRDLKNGKETATEFVSLAWRTFSPVGPGLLRRHFDEVWRQRLPRWALRP